MRCLSRRTLRLGVEVTTRKHTGDWCATVRARATSVERTWGLAEEHEHEHVYQEIYQSDLIGISEETTHHTVTLEMFDRGIVIHLERDEALELARAFMALSRYFEEN